MRDLHHLDPPTPPATSSRGCGRRLLVLLAFLATGALAGALAVAWWTGGAAEVATRLTAAAPQWLQHDSQRQGASGAGWQAVLYHPARRAEEGLLVEQHSLRRLESRTERLEEVARAALAGPNAGEPLEQRVLRLELPAHPLRAAYLLEDGLVVVDLSGELRQAPPATARHEVLAVYGLVHSMLANFPSAETVQVLIDGEAAESLWGHMDLSAPYAWNAALAGPRPAPLEARP